MAEKKPRRRYSDEERANALAALAANRGNVSLTAKQLDIPPKTLENWAKQRVHPEAAKLGDRKKEEMADSLRGIAWRLLESMPEKIPKASLKDTAIAFGIAVEKARLLRDEPTEIHEQRDNERERLFRERYGAAHDAAAGAGVDGQPQPPDPPHPDPAADPVP